MMIRFSIMKACSIQILINIHIMNRNEIGDDGPQIYTLETTQY